MIVNALLMGLTSIGFIGIILVLVFYMFAILGMILFKDNDPWHFGTLQSAMLTLFRCSTLEDWTDVMYINFFGCDQYGYDMFDDLKKVSVSSDEVRELATDVIDFHLLLANPPNSFGSLVSQLCVDPKPMYWVSAFYFVIFTILGALVLLTLFIGVVTTSMDEAQEQQREEQEIEDNIASIQDIEQLSEAEIDTFRKVFSMLDLDGGGTIEEEELRIGLESIGKNPTDAELQNMMKEVDDDESGEIDPSEFVQFMVNLRKKDQQNKEGKVDKDAAREKKRKEREGGGYNFDDDGSGAGAGEGNRNGGGGESEETGMMVVREKNNGIMQNSPMKNNKLVPIAADPMTPVKSMATVGAEHNFGLPVLQSPVNENWLEMSLDVGKKGGGGVPRSFYQGSCLEGAPKLRHKKTSGG